jgi:two-component system, chemotaxis family, protein-glutamate methylesterase/glutaminase
MDGSYVRHPTYARCIGFGCVVLVASLGGMDAFITVLAGLPATFPLPVIVVQHRVHTADGLASVLGSRIDLPVCEAKAGTTAHQRGVTVLPAATRSTIGSDG